MNTERRSIKLQNSFTRLEEIDSYGSHISCFQGIKGRLLSLAHWSSKYDETSLRMRCVEWAQSVSLNQEEYQNCEFNNFFANLNDLKIKNGQAFTEADSSHLVKIVDAFNQNEVRLQSVFTSYCELVKDSSEFNIDYFIAATNKVLAESNGGVPLITKESIKADMDAQHLAANAYGPKLASSLYDGCIWEAACAFWHHKFEAIPALNACLNALTGSVLFTGFWGYLIAGFLATVTTSVVGPAVAGAWNKSPKTSLLDSITQSIVENWKQQVEDENSFHPLLDAFLGSLWIAGTWLYINKLEQAAKVGDLLHTAMQWGMRNFVWKYSTMHFYFTLKADLQKGKISSNVFSAVIMGIIRGFIKNPLAAASLSIQSTFKLSEALNIMNLPLFQRDAYLKFWMSSIPQTIISNTESLISALWLARDTWEGFIVNFSYACAESTMLIVAHLCKFRRAAIAAIIVGLIAYYQNESLQQYFARESVTG